MSGLIRKAIEVAVDGVLGEVARQAGPSRMLAEARTAGLLAAEPFARALSAPPPDLTIEQLVDALIDRADEAGYARARGIAHRPGWAARSALLAAIRSQVPADLAALLRENLAAYEAWLSGVDDGDSLRFNRSQKALADWIRANLKATP